MRQTCIWGGLLAAFLWVACWVVDSGLDADTELEAQKNAPYALRTATTKMDMEQRSAIDELTRNYIGPAH